MDSTDAKYLTEALQDITIAIYALAQTLKEANRTRFITVTHAGERISLNVAMIEEYYADTDDGGNSFIMCAGCGRSVIETEAEIDKLIKEAYQ